MSILALAASRPAQAQLGICLNRTPAPPAGVTPPPPPLDDAELSEDTEDVSESKLSWIIESACDVT